MYNLVRVDGGSRMKNNIRALSVMLGIATILLSVAFATITNSFALPNKVQDKIFDIRITDIDSTGINLDDIRITNTNILFNTHLSFINPSNSFIMEITNNGNIDAKVNKITSIYYDDNYLFEYNNNKYYLRDFTVYTINYASNNNKNNVVIDSKVSEDDNLLINTNNKIMVTIRLKNENELSEEEKEALNYYLDRFSIEKSISISIDYQEK